MIAFVAFAVALLVSVHLALHRLRRGRRRWLLAGAVAAFFVGVVDIVRRDWWRALSPFEGALPTGVGPLLPVVMLASVGFAVEAAMRVPGADTPGRRIARWLHVGAAMLVLGLLLNSLDAHGMEALHPERSVDPP